MIHLRRWSSIASLVVLVMGASSALAQEIAPFDIIQFLGLITFVANDNGVEAILPSIAGDNDIHAHDAIILFPHNTATIQNWPAGTLIIKNRLAKTEEQWDYVELHGETVRFNREASPRSARPTFLPRLNDGCCGWIVGLGNDYEEHGNPASAGHIIVPGAQLGWAKDSKRVDTIARLNHNPDVPLTITATSTGRERRLTFRNPAQVVIANFPIKLLTCESHHAGTLPHFLAYYRMANLGGLCGADRTPEHRPQCRPDFSHPNDFTDFLLIGVSPCRATSDGELYIQIVGADINCSNSTYP